MQKWIAVFICICSLCVQADPFDRTQRQTQTTSPVIVEKPMTLTSCHVTQSALFPANHLNELTLVGVLLQQTEWQALFMNDKKQMQSVYLHQLLTTEGFKIQEINKQGVTLSYWKNKENCSESAILFIKL